MDNREAKDAFYNKKWGVFTHCLYVIQNNPDLPISYGRQTSWDELVNEFDTDVLANNLHEIGAGYLIFTVMQGKRYMIAPNATFDKIAGTVPGEACSSRDLIEDLYQSLSKYNIDLFLYYTGDGPVRDQHIGEKFGLVQGDSWKAINKPFVEKWTSVLEEYATRYGDKIKGWWIDGCYKEFLGYTDDLLEMYYNVCKKGNPNCLVALNNGVFDEGIAIGYEKEDFTCGERNYFDFIPDKRFYGNAQAHILAPLGNDDSGIGQTWASFGCGYTKEYLAEYVKKVHDAGGVVSIDTGIYRDGKFDEAQKQILKYVGEYNKTIKTQ